MKYDLRNRIDPRVLKRVIKITEGLLLRFGRADWVYVVGLSLEDPHYIEEAFKAVRKKGVGKQWEGKYRWPVLVPVDATELPAKPTEAAVYGKLFDPLGE